MIANVGPLVPIDPAIFTRAEPHILEGFRELEAILADPARTCTFLEDLRSNDIILTAPSNPVSRSR